MARKVSTARVSRSTQLMQALMLPRAKPGATERHRRVAQQQGFGAGRRESPMGHTGFVGRHGNRGFGFKSWPYGWPGARRRGMGEQYSGYPRYGTGRIWK